MRILMVFSATLWAFSLKAQVSHDSAAFFIREIYRQSYTELIAHDWLTAMCRESGPRLSGSENAARAVSWTRDLLQSFDPDSVWLQDVKVPRWVRGEKERAVVILSSGDSLNLRCLALGNSPGTGPAGICAGVIEAMSLDELRSFPDDSVRGKIVFYNRPMDPGQINTFAAYGGAADQRTTGPIVAAEKGAVAVVIRSLASGIDTFPHTGMTTLSPTIKNIPSIAISTSDANVLTRILEAESPRLFIRTTCEMKDSVISHNVIGEIRGSEFPREIILVGGHLDSWDVGDGAHDDGSGCMHAVEVMYRLKKNNYRPKRTIRCVLFMNEENGLRGGTKYAREAIRKNEYHLVAIESDAGGSIPLGFGCSGGEGVELDRHLAYMSDYFNLLGPYNLSISAGGGGADIGPLRPKAGLLIGMRMNSARYFDFHHSENDVVENVHPRELASGSAALTSLVYLIDQYGIGR